MEYSLIFMPYNGLDDLVHKMKKYAEHKCYYRAEIGIFRCVPMNSRTFGQILNLLS